MEGDATEHVGCVDGAFLFALGSGVIANLTASTFAEDAESASVRYAITIPDALVSTILSMLRHAVDLCAACLERADLYTCAFDRKDHDGETCSNGKEHKVGEVRLHWWTRIGEFGAEFGGAGDDMGEPVPEQDIG